MQCLTSCKVQVSTDLLQLLVCIHSSSGQRRTSSSDDGISKLKGVYIIFSM